MRSLLVVCLVASCSVDPRADEVTRGRQAVLARGCPACHDPGDGSLSGQLSARPGTHAYGSNLTPDDDSGLGHWTEDQIVRALRDGLDDQGVSLCSVMPRFASMSLDEAQSIAAYLRALPPRNVPIPDTVCDDGTDGGVDLAVSPGSPLAPDLSLARDLSTASPLDLASRDLASPDLAPPPDLGEPACAPVLNELATAGIEGVKDEFVELFNPCVGAVALDGWRLVYRSAGGTRDEVLVELHGSVGAGRFLVCAGADFAGVADFRYANGLSAAGGGLALRDRAGVARDALGWGRADDAFVRGRVAPSPSPGSSLGRHPDGAGVGDNAADFTVGCPTPGHPN
jgi:hypothetical protein